MGYNPLQQKQCNVIMGHENVQQLGFLGTTQLMFQKHKGKGKVVPVLN
jgi:hypothetical protein